MGKHLVFYDGECGFCSRSVQFIINHDPRELFDFAPLQGATAERKLHQLPNQVRNSDSLILIENYQSSNSRLYILGKGAFRICWLLGGVWSIPGALSFLPSFLYDWGYCLIAKNRHKLSKNLNCSLPPETSKHRFLP